MPLFSTTGFFATSQQSRQYDATADGRRFQMMRTVGALAHEEIVIVDNWAEELKAKRP